MAFSQPQPPGPRPPPLETLLPPDNDTLFQGFEWYLPSDAAHWRRLESVLPALRGLGISSLWIPPACKAGWYTGNGYDLYDLYDLGEFDQKGSRHTKWGTKEELVSLAESARRCGVRVLFDVVLNHKAAADQAEEVLAVKIDPKGERASEAAVIFRLHRTSELTQGVVVVADVMKWQTGRSRWNRPRPLKHGASMTFRAAARPTAR